MRRGAGLRREETDGLECIFAGIPVAFFNVGLVTEHQVSADALRTHGERACSFAAEKGVPWLFIHQLLGQLRDAVRAL